MRTLFKLTSLLVAVLTARAEEMALTLLASQGPHYGGQVVRLEVIALNPSGHEAPFTIASVLRGTLAHQGRQLPVLVESVGAAPAAVPAGGFAARAYDLRLPRDASGEAVLTLHVSEGSALRTVLTIEPVLAGPAVALHQPTPGPVERLLATSPAISAVSRNFTGRFLPNLPVYFIYGDADQAAKFQFSFDYRLATLGAGDDEVSSSVRTLRVGYTQRSLWDLDGTSSPFYDTSYMPEIAFNSDQRLPVQQSPIFTWLGWRASLHHESNGREGADSRSLNTIYFRPRFVVGKLGSWAFVLLPEIQAYLGESDGNADIKDYRGYGKLRFYFGHNEGPTLMFTGWTGKDFDHATHQVDLAVPIRLRWLKFESYFYAQYFNGYGESLRSYSSRSESLRAGFGLIR